VFILLISSHTTYSDQIEHVCYSGEPCFNLDQVLLPPKNFSWVAQNWIVEIPDQSFILQDITMTIVQALEGFSIRYLRSHQAEYLELNTTIQTDEGLEKVSLTLEDLFRSNIPDLLKPTSLFISKKWVNYFNYLLELRPSGSYWHGWQRTKYNRTIENEIYRYDVLTGPRAYYDWTKDIKFQHEIYEIDINSGILLNISRQTWLWGQEPELTQTIELISQLPSDKLTTYIENLPLKVALGGVVALTLIVISAILLKIKFDKTTHNRS
jgi:hypothetical protein